MRRSIQLGALGFFIVTSPLAHAAATQDESACECAAKPAQSPADTAFRKLYTDEWSWRQQQVSGDEDSGDAAIRPDLPDVSPEAQAKRLARWQSVEKSLDAIDRSALSPANRTNYDVYRQQISVLIGQQQFKDYQRPLNSDTSFWGNLASTARQSFTTETDYRNYLSQLNQMPRYFDQQIANMRAGLARGFTPPKITLQGRDDTVRSVIDVKTPQDSVFYKPFATMPANIPDATKAELRAEAVEAITRSVIPAHQKLLTFLTKDYIPNAQASIAAYDLPDGKAYYQSKIREFTTLDMTPAQIHQIGLDEVAEIRSQMLQTMKDAKFDGTLPQFLHFLRTGLQFYAKTPEELLKDAAWISKEFDGIASKWIGHLPRSRFAIEPVPADIAPYYTSGRGGPGIYLVNTYDLASRPLYSLPALTLHESAPGHAFQMPLAAENKDLPAFRQNTYISAYGEGWALYCEWLGQEMGMYKTPYDRFGMLSYQMWRAARLVVDTGIHSMGWSREQAQRYLHDNTALADQEIKTEVDRYIAWPGQALSYYIGEMTIRNDRARAEKALGPKFNIRAFHDAVLETGSVPLPVLTARIDKFIADGGKGPYPDEER
ncbi:DUF885 domain-containing protein [Stakelama pacifica]|uniref:Uncharacterized protein (DUF885 family) n=1 Tax=Stakelama pacifica TaxID=517720 RepID=A0A4R6FWY9_9SPHN|nr:DUF885 family protein [Stakelama pacifica]TDN86443.1 uncharacterized protein (DUF885 family) [Stakelama pacifica]GGO89658.1 hypothetical protein GCM10011329_00120 [Stakelama pacifica]